MVLSSIPWWISGRRNVGMCPSWLWSVWVYGLLLFWSPLLCNSWLVQWQSADGRSCSTLQGFVSIVFAGEIPIEDWRLASVGDMLQHLNWHCHEDSRKEAWLIVMCKIANKNVAITKKNKFSQTWENHRICIPGLSLSLHVRLNKDKNCFSFERRYLAGTVCHSP